jgi:DeoR family transcriptional regulator, fructose operon transcriptional repressor
VEQPLPAERHHRIRELLRERGAARVSTLADLLGVSEVTVRRDLEELERRGQLERTHGGAILSQHMGPEPAYREAVARNPEQKRQIGEAAARLADSGETVFLNGGSTTLEVFRRLDGVKVVTNHVGAALESAERGLDLMLVGGEYRAPSNSCVGVLAIEMLRRVFATRAFIGVEGLSIRAGLTTPAAAEAEIARTMIEQTQGDVIVVADSSKMGTVADFQITTLERVSRIVTDPGLDPGYRRELADLGVEIVIAGDQVGAPPRGG